MALAFTITLEKDLANAYTAYHKGGAGKALAREADRIDAAAARKKVTPITSLMSESQAALIAQLKADGFDPSKMRLPPEQWFAPTDGLKTIQALIEHINANLNDFKQPNPILRDLRAAETLLVEAEKASIRFHFTRADL